MNSKLSRALQLIADAYKRQATWILELEQVINEDPSFAVRLYESLGEEIKARRIKTPPKSQIDKIKAMFLRKKNRWMGVSEIAMCASVTKNTVGPYVSVDYAKHFESKPGKQGQMYRLKITPEQPACGHGQSVVVEPKMGE